MGSMSLPVTGCQAPIDRRWERFVISLPRPGRVEHQTSHGRETEHLGRAGLQVDNDKTVVRRTGAQHQELLAVRRPDRTYSKPLKIDDNRLGRVCGILVNRV